MDGIAIFFNQDMSVGGTFMDIEKIMKTGIMLITLGNTISGLFLTMKGKR